MIVRKGRLSGFHTKQLWVYDALSKGLVFM